MSRRDPLPGPNPREVRFVANLAKPALVPPKLGVGDPVFTRRVEADRLCLWLACSRALCRSSRHCVGTYATCIFENPNIVDRILR